jgi:hypothetical protein
MYYYIRKRTRLYEELEEAKRHSHGPDDIPDLPEILRRKRTD